MKIKHKIWRRQKLDKILKKWYNYIVKMRMKIGNGVGNGRREQENIYGY
jgi:hypothetical protein